MFDAIQSWDLSVLSSMRDIKDPMLVWAAWAASSIAWKGWLWWVTIAGAWVRGERKFSAQLALSMLVCVVAGLSLKGVFQRPRPDLYASIQLNIPMPELMSTQHSFPSGHTLLAAAFAFVVVSYYRDFRAWLAIGLVVAIGLARVYQGMHWPSDIIGSIVLGVIAGAIAGQIIKAPIIRRFTEPAAKSKKNNLQLVGAGKND